jgi:nucleoside-diphosphate-sugar epimerase
MLENNFNVILLSDFISNHNLYDDFDLIIHTASPASPKNFNVIDLNFANIEYLNELIIRQKILKEVVFFSTAEVYGQNQTTPVLESKVNLNFNGLKRGIYPKVKIDGERLLLELSVKKNFKPRIIRLFHTFGPGIRKGDGRSISDFFWDVAQGQKPSLYSQGHTVRTYLYVADLVSALFIILNSNSEFTFFNVGSPTPNSIKEFAEKVSKSGGNSHPLLKYVDEINFDPSPINYLVPDLSAIISLGWYQKFSLDKGIELTLNWMERNLSVK